MADATTVQAQGDDTQESVAGLTATVIPYTDEDGGPDPYMSGLVMLAIGRPGDVPEHVLDRIPADAAEIIRQHSEAQAAEIARLTAGQDAGREIMRQALECLNSFRAQHGSPHCLSTESFDAFLQSLADMLGDDRKPWMTDAAKNLIGPYAIAIGQEQDATIAAEERATKAKTDVDLLDRVIGDLAEELGVAQDNEAMHEAIQAIKDGRDAALAQVAAMREALGGLANVVERDCGVDPCASSMAPAERYLGMAREALSAEVASNFIVIPRDQPPAAHSPDAVE